MTKHIIYKITYIPHKKAGKKPYYYIGSKYNYKGNYYGSLSSKQKSWYSGEDSISVWWKKQVKNNPKNFKFEIIKYFDNISTNDLVSEEKKIHLKYDVTHSDEYFNMSMATLGFVSCKKTNVTKKIMSEKTKAFWDSPDGNAKRKRLSERNKKTKSKEMKKLWSNPTEAMLNRVTPGRPKGASDSKPRKEKQLRKIKCYSKVYPSAKHAADELGTYPIKVRCWARKKYNGWSWVYE